MQSVPLKLSVNCRNSTFSAVVYCDSYDM